jgi:hypothetical protein
VRQLAAATASFAFTRHIMNEVRWGAEEPGEATSWAAPPSSTTSSAAARAVDPARRS